MLEIIDLQKVRKGESLLEMIYACRFCSDVGFGDLLKKISWYVISNIDCGVCTVFCHGTNLLRVFFFSLFQMFNFNWSGLVGGKKKLYEKDIWCMIFSQRIKDEFMVMVMVITDVWNVKNIIRWHGNDINISSLLLTWAKWNAHYFYQVIYFTETFRLEIEMPSIQY